MIVPLSPHVEEPLNSKEIKSFVPELRSRVFRVSRFLCSMYICYEHYMSISHMAVFGYGKLSFLLKCSRKAGRMNWVSNETRTH